MTAQARVLQMQEPEAVALIREGAALKAEIDEKSERLREIHGRAKPGLQKQCKVLYDTQTISIASC